MWSAWPGRSSDGPPSSKPEMICRGRRRGGNGGSSAARSFSGPLGSKPKPLKEFALERIPRFPVTIGEFNRVLGGGIVPGGSVLVGGEPGIGKSTLLLQLLGALSESQESAWVLRQR